VESGSSLVVIDPGMVSSTSVILNPIMALGREPEDVTDVVLSHHHPDHTMNTALFPNARVHDHWAVYKDDTWTLGDSRAHGAGHHDHRHGRGQYHRIHPPVVVRDCPIRRPALHRCRRPAHREGAGARGGDPDRARSRYAVRPHGVDLSLASKPWPEQERQKSSHRTMRTS
jgi:hypothetical protein